MDCSKQIVHLQETTLQVRPVFVCRPTDRSVGKLREVRSCLEDLLKEIVGVSPQSPSLVLIPIIMSKLT